jgi:hypothetical protein
VAQAVACQAGLAAFTYIITYAFLAMKKPKLEIMLDPEEVKVGRWMMMAGRRLVCVCMYGWMDGFDGCMYVCMYVMYVCDVCMSLHYRLLLMQQKLRRQPWLQKKNGKEEEVEGGYLGMMMMMMRMMMMMMRLRCHHGAL